MKAKLIAKVLEKLSDLDIQESLEAVNLCVHEVVDEAIQAKLETMSEDQLLELL